MHISSQRLVSALGRVKPIASEPRLIVRVWTLSLASRKPLAEKSSKRSIVLEVRMSEHRYLKLVVVVALAFAAAPLRAEEPQPEVVPTRDVDISYDVTRRGQPPIVERRRWLASEHLLRVDGPDKSSTIFDRNKGEFTLLNPANRTYRKFEGSPRMPMAPVNGIPLKRGAEASVAGLRCVDWSGTDGDEIRTWCLTPDGVLLRLVIDGKTILRARSVKYGPQSPTLFEIPRKYEPAIAPEGGPAD